MKKLDYKNIKSFNDDTLYEWSVRKVRLPKVKEATTYICGMVSGFTPIVKQVESYDTRADKVTCIDGTQYTLLGRSNVFGNASAEWQKWCYLNGMDPQQRFIKVPKQ
jgi:hypothetical protein